MSLTIYHNPRCRKSREALQLLRDRGIEPEIVEYLKEVPTEEQLKALLSKLDISPRALLRTGEKVYKEHYTGRELTDAQWISAMVEHPKLIERPIVVSGNRAVVGRPPEKVLEILQ